MIDLRAYGITKETALLSCVILLLAGTLGVWTYSLTLNMKVHRALEKSALASRIGRAAEAERATTNTTAAGPPALPKSLDELIRAKHIFGVQSILPSPQSISVLDDAALINGQWMKVGDRNGRMILKEVYNNKVVLEVDGQRHELVILPRMPGLPPDTK